MSIIRAKQGLDLLKEDYLYFHTIPSYITPDALARIFSLELKSKREAAQNDWAVMAESLEKLGLNIAESTQPRISSSNSPNDLRENIENNANADYNGLELKVGMITENRPLFGSDSYLNISVGPNSNVRGIIPYHTDLFVVNAVKNDWHKHTLEIHYDPIDFTPDLVNALTEWGSRIVSQEEIAYSSGTLFKNAMSHAWNGITLPSPFVTLCYSLQKPNERHATCIGAADPDIVPGLIAPDLLLDYEKQEREGHFCRIKREFSILPFKPEFYQKGIGFDLLLSDIKNMEEERAIELLSGLPLTINTTITDENHHLLYPSGANGGYHLNFVINGNPNTQYANPNIAEARLNVRAKDSHHDPFRRDNPGAGRFQFKYTSFSMEDLKDNVTRIMPRFLEVYHAFAT